MQPPWPDPDCAWLEDTGTVHAISGTINANQGFTGITGTAQIDTAGTLTIGANSTVGTLTHNGSGIASLSIGGNNITVSADYTNGNFGTGNSFNKLANVATTGGQILAAGPTPANMQVVTGADVTGGNTGAPTLALGIVHVGDSTTFQIANQGTAANPSLRGAIVSAFMASAMSTSDDPRPPSICAPPLLKAFSTSTAGACVSAEDVVSCVRN